ncbi:RNA polymerase sigma-70 factor, ECF subfamily [Rhizobiales bacterium GAS191]|jgi:RNA polymerase sigma factor (sigma-70 family)|nr:RNA polymerase sigma-70 factor, ECF subfamily [Rhizobiales bacterium GAS113]SEE22308.1 RNA polymerase sigma-70 factor, ECF subfamily [Rhizobiales bacterium GAS191]SEE33915.1 RNA polymerase sigma-70 factor, ECF subfamily [Rhizobiales bacterium GAS188]
MVSMLPESVFTAARLGDQDAIARLLETAQPDIRRYARSTCRSSADAEDAAQEALWLLFRRVGTIRSLAAFSGWLFTVVRRECLRLARRAGVLPAQSLQEIDLERAFGERPEAEMRLDLAAAIEALPSHYRDVVLLRDVKEMTVDEIAEALGDTRPSVKARLHRARLLMREYLTR